MGTKLILILLLVVNFFSACTSTKKNATNNFFVKKSDFLEAYKASFMCGCFNEATKGNFNIFLEKNNDLGLFTETDLISYFIVKEADSLGRSFSSKIKPFTYGDAKGGVPNYSSCFYYALSKEVDSIAVKRYKQTLIHK